MPWMVSAWKPASLSTCTIDAAVMVEAGDRENESEDQNDSTDDGTSRNICSMPLCEANHSVMANPRRMFCLVVPAMGTIAGNSRSDNC